ncbi:trypsin-like peptidase domain-containing protein [Micromonospora gifhornensis]|uniref:nSTAND1 domain-containing NTPase n=1 Tax=Micromonospora gifhornensis TaxID=84594 RepID=UPI003D7167EC
MDGDHMTTIGDVPSAGATMTPALVRLLEGDGTACGLGLLVTGRQVVTCAHVVNLALGLPHEATDQPGTPVQLDFPFIAPGQRYTAEVVAWQPSYPDGSGDIAGLRLHVDPPEGVKPCPPANVDNLQGHGYQVFGFTPAHPTGVWVKGEIRGPDVSGYVQLGGDPTGGPRLAPGFSGAPVWDEELQAVVGIAGRATIGRTPSGGYCLPTRLLVRAWPELEEQIRPPNPYRGLLPMRENDARNFFGRAQASRRLASQLPHGRLSLVMGPSGSGKSSVIRAGVLPLLRVRDDLLIALCRPGMAPVPSLTRTLAEAAGVGLPQEPGSGQEVVSRAADGSASRQADAGGAHWAGELEGALKRTGRERLFLIIDQFEELFSHPRQTRSDFARLIGVLAGATRPDGRPLCCLVLVARSDFADEITETGSLADALALGRDDPTTGVHYLLPMTDVELREAIEGPLEQLRVTRYEHGLVDRLMRDVRRLDNPLAPLAFTLTRLWELQQGGRVSLAAYEALGGVAGAMREHFDRVMDEELDSADRETARLLLLRLTAPDGRGGHIRRSVARDELDQRDWTIARRLAGRRIITIMNSPGGGEAVELAHEALLAEWPRLRAWLDEEKDYLGWRNTLSGAMEMWVTSGCRSNKLLDRADLTVSLAAIERWEERLTSSERAFIKRSQLHQRRTRLLLIAGSTVATMVVAALVFVVGSFRGIVDSVDTDVASRASRSMVSWNTNIVQALPSNLAAYRRYPTLEARQALARWDERAALVEKIRPGEVAAPYHNAILSPDKRHVLGRWAPGWREMLWDIERPGPPDITIGEPDEPASGHTFTSDGAQVIYASDDQIVFWEVQRRSAARSVPIRAPRDGAILGIAISADGRTIAYYDESSAYVADARTGRLLSGPFRARPNAHSKVTPTLSFDKEDRHLSYSSDQDDWTIDWRSGKEVNDANSAMAVDDTKGVDEPYCVDGRDSVKSHIVMGGSQIVELPRECRGYNIKVDRATGDLLLFYNAADPSLRSAPADEVLEIYDLGNGARRGKFRIPDGAVVAVEPSPEGARVILAPGDGYVLLRIPPPDTLARELSVATSAALTPDGRHVATLSVEGTLGLWDVDTGQRLQAVNDPRLRAATPRRASVVISPDGGRVAAIGDGHVRTIGVTAPNTVAAWNISEQDGWKPQETDNESYRRLTASFTDAGNLLIRSGDLISRWDAIAGLRIGEPLTLPIQTYAQGWSARPATTQFAITQHKTNVIELWDIERHALVTSYHLPADGSPHHQPTVVFDDAGRLAAIHRAPRNPIVIDADSGDEVARLPLFGKGIGLSAEPQWESGFSSPLSFAGDRTLILSYRNVLHAWTWPRWYDPFTADEVATWPSVEWPGTGIDRHARTVLLPNPTGGWWIRSTDPEQWRAVLCELFIEGNLIDHEYTKANVTEATRLAGRSLCGKE